MDSSHVFRRCAVPIVLVLVLVVVAPSAVAGPGEHSSRYGSTAGDPRVFEDGAPCFEAVLELGLDGTQCVVLYGHIFDLLNAVPINVQRPIDGAYDLSRGFSGVAGVESIWDFNQLALYSSPGFVEYTSPEEIPDIHPERGITKDVFIDSRVPLKGFWYLSADYDEAPMVGDVPDAETSPDIGVLPCLSVRMVLSTGRYYGTGETLAEGVTTKHVVSRGGGDELELAAPTVDCPGAGPSDLAFLGDATEFEVDMVPVVDPMVIPADQGFVVHVEWYQFAPGNPDNQDKLYMGQTNVRTGEQHLARVLLPIAEAIEIERVTPVSFDGFVYVQVVANSPWGSYDVDPGSIAFSLRDAAGQDVALQHVEPPRLVYSVDHNGHFEPVIALFKWNQAAEQLPLGEYEIVATAKNWQHTATATGIGGLSVLPREQIRLVGGGGEVTTTPAGAGDAQSTPAAPLSLAVLALAGLAFAAPRRGRS